MSQDAAGRPTDAARPFELLAEALRRGDDEAWGQVVKQYTPRLIGLARSRLDNRLRQKLSAVDVVQSVYRTFIRRHAEKPFNLDSWDSLWGLLVVMTIRKCCRWHEYYYKAQRRDIRREIPWQKVSGQSSSVETRGTREPIDRQPTPAEAALLVETLHETLRGLDERERQIIQLGLLGDPEPEIAAHVGRTQYTVRKVRRRYAGRLQELCEPDLPDPAQSSGQAGEPASEQS